MNEVWKKIFKDYIECYNAMQTLYKKEIIDFEEFQKMKFNLLYEIIQTFESEVGE